MNDDKKPDLSASTSSASTSLHVEEVRELILSLLKLMVDSPGDVSLTIVTSSRGTILYATVAPGDVGKLIGRAGRTARSLRTILTVIGKSIGCELLLDLGDSLPNN